MEKLIPPKLGPFLEQKRHNLKISRELLAQNSSSSVSYITKLENGERDNPTGKAMSALADALHLTAADRMHIDDLIRADVEPPTMQMYAGAIEPRMLARLDHMVPYLGAYLDERWTILASNSAYDQAYPDLAKHGNVLSWFFRSLSARRVMVEWCAEALLTVGWFRGLMGKYGSPDWAMDILDDLSTEPEFREMWERQTVSFGRHQPLMHLRHPETGEYYSVDVQITRLPDRPDPVQFFEGIPLEYSGPETLLD